MCEELKNQKKERHTTDNDIKTASKAFIVISWVCLFTGIAVFMTCLYSADMQFREKGYLFLILLLGLLSVISLKKRVLDKQEGFPLSNISYIIGWLLIIGIFIQLVIVLWNADLVLSEKGIYGISYILSLFSAVVIQQNIRDTIISRK